MPARALFLTLVASLSLAAPARADLQLCNKTSYVLDLALGLEEQGAAATRGWFRVDPGACKAVLQGTPQADRIYVHARAPAAYGPSPLPLAGQADFCVAEGNFVIAAAKSCQPRAAQRLARFSQIKPSDSEQGLTAYLSEEAEYDVDQARLAGIQRLLVIAGYDANPIDGLEGKKTTAALDQFLKDRRLPADAPGGTRFFQTMLDAVKTADGVGFSWCNETSHSVMAALGVDDNGAVTTRGWYRVDAGKCIKPDLPAKPGRLYSFAEAVDKEGQALKRADKLLIWGGPKQLCTRDVRFEISEQRNCGAQGLTATGFAVIEMTDNQGATVRFRE
jgi:uncharacterized membrane protein